MLTEKHEELVKLETSILPGMAFMLTMCRVLGLMTKRCRNFAGLSKWGMAEEELRRGGIKRRRRREGRRGKEEEQEGEGRRGRRARRGGSRRGRRGERGSGYGEEGEMIRKCMRITYECNNSAQKIHM